MDIDMDTGYAAWKWTCSMDMVVQHGKGHVEWTRTCNMDMDMDMDMHH
jgi:hypothetical protein